MKYLQYIIITSLIFVSCNVKKQGSKNIIDENITIPDIEKNIGDINFKEKNGILFLKEKPFSGIVKEFYVDGNIKSISEYYLGKRHGKFFGYYPKGNKWFERFYKKGIKVETHKGWFINGIQMFEYQLNNNGVYDGFIKDWHYNGQLAKYFNFKNGKEEGAQKMWRSNGKIRANFFTINGERHGLIGLKNCVSILSKKNQ